MIEKNEKVFRGVWVPAEIWETHILSWMEKCLWAEISCLGNEKKPCFASNAYLAAKFNSTESSISNMISKLRSLGMIKHISYDGRSRKMVAILVDQTSPSGEVRVHTQVKSDSTHRCNRENRGEQKLEQKPLTPLQGEVENSAEASSSTSDEKHIAGATECADARSGKSDDLNSRPPHSEEERVQRGSRKSPPKKREPKIVDETFIAKLKAIYPNLDIDTELRKMDAWLLANPTRKKSQQFVSNWINRAAERVAKNNPPKQTCPDEKEDPEGFNAFWASVKPND
jgi:hypothetical protein